MNKKNDYNRRTGELNVVITMTYSEFQDLRSYLTVTWKQLPYSEAAREAWPCMVPIIEEFHKD